MTRILILVALSLSLCSPANAFQDGGGKPTKTPPAKPTTPSTPKPKVEPHKRSSAPAPAVEVTTPSGLKYLDKVVGTGESPRPGQNVTVHYAGTLTNGAKVDSSVDRGQPYTFQIGVGRVIKGWDEGVMTMKVGGKRRLIIPSSLGYGAAGRPPKVPPDATLIFELELLSVSADNNTPTSPAAAPAPATAGLTIRSTQPNCSVLIDGEFVGVTDEDGLLNLPSIKPGEHIIIGRKEQYRDAQLAIFSEANRNQTAHLALSPMRGTLSVNLNVSGAQIEVGGRGSYADKVSKLELDPGSYSITASKPGYRTVTREVDIRSGMPSDVSLTLELSAEEILAERVKNVEALTTQTQSYYLNNDFGRFITSANSALSAGASLEFHLKHHHAFGAELHSVKLTLTARSVSFDPEVAQALQCTFRQFTLPIEIVNAQLKEARGNGIYLNLTLQDPADPKKKTYTLNFADMASYFVQGSGGKMESRAEGAQALTALSRVFQYASTRARSSTANPPPVSATPSGASATSTKELVSKAIDAAGGLALLQSIKDMYSVGTAVVPAQGNQRLEMKTYWAAPNKYRLEINSNKTAGIYLFDGSEGSSFTTKGKASKPADETKQLRIISKLTGPSLYLHLLEPGTNVQSLGSQQVNGRLSEVIRVADNDNDNYELYFDAETHLPAKCTYQLHASTGMLSIEGVITDYFEVQGFKMARQGKSYVNGVLNTEETVTEVKINTGLNTMVFIKPVK